MEQESWLLTCAMSKGLYGLWVRMMQRKCSFRHLCAGVLGDKAHAGGGTLGNRLNLEGKAEMLLFFSCFLVYLSFGCAITPPLPADAFSINEFDFYWGADSNRAFSDATSILSGNGHYRIKVHPLFLILVQPLALVLQGVTGSATLSMVILQSGAAAGMVACFYAILRRFEVQVPIRVMFSIIFAMSFSNIVFAAVPETFIFAGLGLIGFWCYLTRIVDRCSDLSRVEVICLVFFGVISFGITITNFVAYLIGMVYLYAARRRYLRLKSIFSTIAMVVLGIVLLVLWQTFVWPGVAPFWDSFLSAASGQEAYEETRYMNFSFSASKTVVWAKQGFLYPLISPEMAFVEGKGIRFGSFGLVQCIGLMALAALAVLALILFFRHQKEHRLKRITVIFLCIAYACNLALHYMYGYGEVFIYSPHFLFLPLVALALCLSFMKNGTASCTQRGWAAVMALAALLLITQAVSNTAAAAAVAEMTAQYSGVMPSLKKTPYLVLLTFFTVLLVVAAYRKVLSGLSEAVKQGVGYELRYLIAYGVVIMVVSGYVAGVY